MIPRNAFRAAVVAAALLAVGATTAKAQRTVYPSGPWVSDVRGSNGSAQITGNNPRNGNGSLELGTTGDPFDWGAFNLFSNDPLGFGALGNLNHLSFDWYRLRHSCWCEFRHQLRCGGFAFLSSNDFRGFVTQ